jgi:acyl-CoA synthetase (AMP-forming)/AMP-acid ligase II
MVASTLACVAHAATVVIPAPVFDARATLAAVAEERCTALHGAPTMFVAELNHPDFDQLDLSSLRGSIVPHGTPGELLARVYHVMLGYWNNPHATAEVMDAARWMHNGDLATMDKEGFVNIVGWSTDMIIRGGENVYPRELEELLHATYVRPDRATGFG